MKYLLLGLIFSICLISCSDKTISDNATTENVSVLNPSKTKNFKVFSPLNDSMDRGHHDLTENVVIDPHDYNQQPLKRGDIIYFQDKFLSRVVGLSNEKIKIVSGQIYINGAKLDTFYGSAHYRGNNYKDFLNSDLEDPAKTNIINEIYKKNQEEITLGSSEVYVVSDDWVRSSPEFSFRSLAIDKISGKVVGVCPDCTSH